MTAKFAVKIIPVANDQRDPTKQNNTIEVSPTGDQPASTEPKAVVDATVIVDPPKQPTRKQTYPSDLIVLLDIDTTMICSKLFYNEAKAQAYIKRMPKDSKSNATVDYLYIEMVREDGGGSVYHIINHRPGLKDFLHKVGTTFETHIFTAGNRAYAHSIAKILDPGGVYFGDRIWHDSHCKIRGGGDLYKDLSALPLGRDSMDRVVLIDDYVVNLRANPSNAILVKDFEDDPEDRELERVLATLQSFKDSTVDVRPILRKKKEEVDPAWFAAMFS